MFNKPLGHSITSILSKKNLSADSTTTCSPKNAKPTQIFMSVLRNEPMLTQLNDF